MADAAVEAPAPAPLEPVERPDRAKFDSAVTALNQEISDNQRKRDAVQQKFVATRTSNDELNARITEARARFQAIKLEHAKLKDERSALLGERDAARSSADKLTGELKELRGKFKFSSVDDVDRRLAQLQLRQATESMSLKEERELIREIEALRAQRGQLGRVSDLATRSEEAWAAARESGKETSERLTELTDALRPVSERLNAAYEVLQTYQKERDEARASIPALIAERETFNTAVTTAMAALRAAKNAYYNAERAYNAWAIEDRRRAAAAAALEREEKAKAREADREARVAARAAAAASGAALPADEPAADGKGAAGEAVAPAHPWAAQMAEADVLLAYLQRLRPKAAAPAAAPKPAAFDAGAASGGVALKGLKGEALRARGDDSDDLAFLRKGPGAAAGGRKGGKRGGAKAAAEDEDGEPVAAKPLPLSFQLDALASFGLFGVAPPPTTAELDETIAAVEAKKLWYETAPPPAPKAAPAGATGGGFGRGGGAAGRGAGRGARGAAAPAAAAPAAAAAATLAPGARVSTPYGPGVVESVGAAEGGSPLVVVNMAAFFAKGYLQADQVKPAPTA